MIMGNLLIARVSSLGEIVEKQRTILMRMKATLKATQLLGIKKADLSKFDINLQELSRLFTELNKKYKL